MQTNIGSISDTLQESRVQSLLCDVTHFQAVDAVTV